MPRILPVLCLSILAAGRAIAAPETPVSPVKPEADSDRLRWWREARFGMFIHWSPSSVNGTEIGWGRKAKRPMEAPGNGGSPAGPGVDPVYDNLFRQFDPKAYDPDAWVKLARDSGMKYMVLTSKHHEGFSLWPTRARADFNIATTPYKDGKGDILRGFADACHRADMRFGWYYSPRDWTHPDYGVGDNAKYDAFMTKQMDELFSNYGKVDMVWWDSFGVGDSHAFWHADKFLKQVKSLQPGIISNNRCNSYAQQTPADLRGDFDTPEGTIGKYRPDRPWESCITLVGHHWSFEPGGDMMSFDRIISMLVSCATGDGNLLLNTGPMPDGRIEPRQAELLLKVGDWMKKYGESIYGTRGGPFPNGKWGGVTFRDDTVYLHLLPASPDTLEFPVMNETLTGSVNLTGGAVGAVQKDGVIRVTLPPGSRTTPVTLIRLKFDKPVTRVSGKVRLAP